MYTIEDIGSFGAYIKGINLKECSEDQKKEIKGLFSKYKVLAFLDQDLDFKDIDSVAKYFGNIYQHPGNGFLVDEKYPNIQVVERNKDTFLFGGYWHSDNSGLKVRPSCTMLYSEIVPDVGGDTQFTDQHKVYDNLPAIIKEYINDKYASHSWVRNSLKEALDSNGKVGFGASLFKEKSYTKEEVDDILEIKYPNFNILEKEHQKNKSLSSQKIVIQHPYSNELCLNVNSAYTREIEGIDKEESNKILNMLFTVQNNSSFQISVKWYPKMLLVWDNRSLTHRATRTNIGDERVMYRLMVVDPIDSEVNVYGYSTSNNDKNTL